MPSNPKQEIEHTYVLLVVVDASGLAQGDDARAGLAGGLKGDALLANRNLHALANGAQIAADSLELVGRHLNGGRVLLLLQGKRGDGSDEREMQGAICLERWKDWTGAALSRESAGARYQCP